jgi:hypothetical protein
MEIILKEHLVAVKWDPNTPPYSFLFLRNLDESPKTVYKKPIILNQEFNVEVTEERVCIGHSINKQEYYLCSNFVEKQYVRCYNCEQADFEKCFLFCDASKPFGNCSPNPAAYEYCETHSCSVYLALIANNIKVGVSFNPLKRWVNQGADMAVEVFRAKNGFEARELEKIVSTTLNIPQTIRKTQKARTLNYDLTRSLPMFREIKIQVIELLEKSKYEANESDLLLKETDLSSFYGKIPSLSVNPIFNDVEKTLQIVGEVIGIKGKLLVTAINNSYYVTNLNKIIGNILLFSSKPLKLKGQKSLSDFLN